MAARLLQWFTVGGLDGILFDGSKFGVFVGYLSHSAGDPVLLTVEQQHSRQAWLSVRVQRGMPCSVAHCTLHNAQCTLGCSSVSNLHQVACLNAGLPFVRHSANLLSYHTAEGCCSDHGAECQAAALNC